MTSGDLRIGRIVLDIICLSIICLRDHRRESEKQQQKRQQVSAVANTHRTVLGDCPPLSTLSRGEEDVTPAPLACAGAAYRLTAGFASGPNNSPTLPPGAI